MDTKHYQLLQRACTLLGNCLYYLQTTVRTTIPTTYTSISTYTFTTRVPVTTTVDHSTTLTRYSTIISTSLSTITRTSIIPTTTTRVSTFVYTTRIPVTTTINHSTTIISYSTRTTTSLATLTQTATSITRIPTTVVSWATTTFVTTTSIPFTRTVDHTATTRTTEYSVSTYTTTSSYLTTATSYITRPTTYAIFFFQSTLRREFLPFLCLEPLILLKKDAKFSQCCFDGNKSHDFHSTNHRNHFNLWLLDNNHYAHDCNSNVGFPPLPFYYSISRVFWAPSDPLLLWAPKVVIDSFFQFAGRT